MSAAAVVILVVGLVSVVTLAALVVAMVRHLKLLAGSLAGFRRATEPILEDIRAQAERAQETALRLQAERQRTGEERDRARASRRRRRRRG